MPANLCDALPQSVYLGDWIELPGNRVRFCHRWLPCVPHHTVEQVCVMVHGLGDHGYQFAELANFMTRRGFAVQSIDLIGHGRSPGRRGRIESFDSLIDEIRWSIQAARSVWRNANICLLGQSMGGNLTAAFLQRQALESASPRDILPLVDAQVQSHVLLSPMFRPGGKQLREDFFQVGKRLAALIPNWPIRMRSKPQLLSNCSSHASQRRRDPFRHGWMSVQLGIGLMESGESLLANPKLSCPTLLMHGTYDRLASFDATAQFADTARSPVHFEVVREGLHDLLHGEKKEEVYSTITYFAVSHTPPSAKSPKTLQVAA